MQARSVTAHVFSVCGPCAVTDRASIGMGMRVPRCPTPEEA